MYSPSDRMLRLAQALRDEVDKNIAGHHCLVTFAKEYNVSKTALFKAFNSITGMSLLPYIEKARAEAALAIMRRSPELKLHEIAQMVGCKTRRLRYAFLVTLNQQPRAVLREIRKQV